MVGVAKSPSALRKRLRRLLSAERGAAGTELANVILPALEGVGAVALIGGAVRDVARGGVAAFKSDLDFVVRGSSASTFDRLMTSLAARPNRFGGYGLRFNRWRVDVWRLETTWAHSAGHCQVADFGDLIHSTFFDWDAAVFELATGKLHLADDYLGKLARGVLDLNLRANPNYQGALVRALRRGAMWNVYYGERLSSFALEMLDHWEWDELVELEENAFGWSSLAPVDPAGLRDRLRPCFQSEMGHVSLPFPNIRIQDLLAL